MKNTPWPNRAAKNDALGQTITPIGKGYISNFINILLLTNDWSLYRNAFTQRNKYKASHHIVNVIQALYKHVTIDAFERTVMNTSWLTKKDRGIVASWIDGYLPTRKELIDTIRKYNTHRYEFSMSRLKYEPEWAYSRDEVFKSAAFLITSDFHAFLGVDDCHARCSIWLARLENADQSHLRNIVAETRANERPQDYKHIISVHGADKAEECLAHLVKSSGFEVKLDNEYQNKAAFDEDRECVLNRVIEVYAAPHFVAGGILRDCGFDVTRYTH